MKRETTLLMVTVITLTLLGIAMVYSTSAVDAASAGMVRKHLFFAALGFSAMMFAARFDYHRLLDPPVYRFIVCVSLFFLMVVLIPGIGSRIDGGQRWIRFAGISFQPSEFGKFALILLLAVKLTENREHIREFRRGFLPPFLIAGAFAAIVLAERDLGVPVLMMGVTCIMIFAAGARIPWLLAGLVPLGGLAGFFAWYAPHRMIRLLAFVDPWAYREGPGWQLIQSLSAFAQGGVFGRGPGAGEQKLGYLPAPNTDFIFAVVGEELGLIGTLVVVALFCALLFAAFRIALHAPDLFGGLLAAGIGSMAGLQAAFIMAVTTGLLPTKGLPLPFISYGGTSLFVYLAMMGVLVNIGAQARAPEPARRLAPAAG
jgi:cell division protein FtsW